VIHPRRLSKEVLEEQAAHLGRLARLLEAEIEELRALLRRMEGLGGEQLEVVRRDFARQRRRALRARWYLEVQREAVGFRSHRDLDRCYPIPAAR
jgi:hypothetical protein